MQNEIWKDVQGFEGVYQISNLGNLCSYKSGHRNLRSNTNRNNDYLAVVLKHEDKIKHTRIHRLVYEAFVGEIPSGKKYHIHHKDGNRQNNDVDNLVLVSSRTHHLIHVRENPKIIDGMVRYNKYIKTQDIYQYDLDGNFIAKYRNGKEASKATGVCQRNILQVAHQEPYNKKGSIRKQAGGFIWRLE